MVFSRLALLFMPVLSALGTNHFAGLTVSNSIGGTGTYTCRTQAQVKFLGFHT
jgi:hypothetical protein